MRKICLLLFALLAGMTSAEAQKQFSLVLNAPFCIYAEPIHQDLKPEPVPICMLPKGTSVTVLGHSWHKEFLQVTLGDGSLGYIPTMAIALSEARIYSKYGGDGWVKGTYHLQSIGAWDGFQPKKLVFRHDNGRTYTFAKSSNFLQNERYKKVLGRIEYGDFFERNGLEYYMSDRDDRVLRLAMKDGELPLALIGCSKSYIDELLSPAFGYAGPSVSEYKGYVYGFYENLIWPMPEVRDGFWGAGVIIYFDQELVAVHMEKMPWTFDFESDYSTLRVSTKPSESYAPEIATAIRKAKGKPRYRKAAPLTERYVALEGGAGLKLKALYIFENHLGITNRWAIIGWLLGTLFVVQFFAYYLVRWFYKGPNKYIGWIGFLIVLPFTIYALIYVSRFYIIVAIIAFIFVVSFSLYASLALSTNAETDRCDRCRRWLGPFKYDLLSTGVRQRPVKRGKPAARMIYNEVRPPFISGEAKIKLGWGRLMSRSGSSSVSGGVQHTTETRAWNFKTRVKIVVPYRVKLECPCCGHVWEHSLSSEYEEPGPILYTIYSDSRDKWTETERIQWRTTDTGELVYEESHDHARSRSHSYSGPRSYDIARYNHYLKRYFKGERSALEEYEREAFGDYWGD